MIAVPQHADAQITGPPMTAIAIPAVSASCCCCYCLKTHSPIRHLGLAASKQGGTVDSVAFGCFALPQVVALTIAAAAAVLLLASCNRATSLPKDDSAVGWVVAKAASPVTVGCVQPLLHARLLLLLLLCSVQFACSLDKFCSQTLAD